MVRPPEAIRARYKLLGWATAGLRLLKDDNRVGGWSKFFDIYDSRMKLDKKLNKKVDATAVASTASERRQFFRSLMRTCIGQ